MKLILKLSREYQISSVETNKKIKKILSFAYVEIISFKILKKEKKKKRGDDKYGDICLQFQDAGGRKAGQRLRCPRLALSV